jgi:hypothetical protein
MADMSDQRLEHYQHIRQVAKAYVSGLVSSAKHPEADPKRVGKILGLYHAGKMIFQSETEVSVMMDFTIAEKLYDGKSLVDLEIESNHDLADEVRAILEAYRSGYTSLFEVLDKDPNKHTIRLYDLLRDDDKEIIDINLSRSVDKTQLLFFRLITFNDFSMTSGISFVFGSNNKEVLLRRYRAELRTRFTIDKSITRFLIFQRLNRQLGQEIRLL